MTVSNRTAISDDFFLPTYTGLDQTIAAGTLAQKVDFTSGTAPLIVAVGDIDGDGKPDLVTANNAVGTISVLRNISASGGINGASFAAKVDFTAGTQPIHAAIGDLDGDGKLDIAVSNGGSDNVSVFRNTSSGSVSLATAVNFTTGTDPFGGVALGDLDGDGKPDLAVTNFMDNTVSVFRNTSTSGSITTSSFAAKVDFTTDTDPRGVKIGDFDGDGLPEIVTANSVGNSVSVLRNTSTPGPITTSSFAIKVDLPANTFTRLLAIGDIDGDGVIDIAAANVNSDNVSVLRNMSTVGTISFDGKVDFATGIGPIGIGLGDIDGDGKPDIAAANNTANTVSVLRNTSVSGTVTFAGKVDVTAATGPWGVSIVDLDGDGRPELAVGNFEGGVATKVSIFHNIADPPTISAITPTSGNVGSSVTLTGTNFDATPGNNTVFFDPIEATVTAASATSLTVTVPSGAGFGPISVTVNNRTAISNDFFLPTFSGTSPTIDTSTLAAKVDFTAGTNPYSVAIGDLDGDGKPDFAVANQTSNTVSVLHNTSTSGTLDANSFAAKVDFTTGTSPRSVAIGDLDGDGKPDLAVANATSNTVSVLHNTSTSGTLDANSFAAKVDFTAGTSTFSVAIGDLDGDGKPDLAVGNQSSATMSVYRNTSISGTLDASFAAKVDFTTGGNPGSVAIGDLDGDGKPDLVVRNQTSNTVSVFRNTSTSGTLDANSFAAKVDFTTGDLPWSVAIGDLDADGKPDLAVASYNSNTVSLYRNTSTSGTLDVNSFAAKVDFTTGSGPWGVAIGDLDGDEKPDLAVANNGAASVSVFHNLTTTVPPPSPVSPPQNDIDALTSANVTATFGQNMNAGTASTFVVHGSLTGERSGTYGGGGTTVISFDPAADFHPGEEVQVSLTTGNQTTGGEAIPAYVWTFRAAAGTGVADFSGPSKNFGTGSDLSYSVAFGDLDGDGDLDLAVGNNPEQNVVYLNDGSGNFTTSRNFGTGTDATVSVALGDIEGDGDLDIVVGNELEQNVVYLNDGVGNFSAGSNFGPGNDAADAVALGDVDGDGDLDIGVGGALEQNVVYLNDGTGSFPSSSDFGTGSDLTAAIAFGDVDLDGDLDVAAGNLGAEQNVVYLNDAAGVFSSGSRNFGTGSDKTVSVVFGDVDADGDPDIGVGNTGEQNAVVLNDGSGNFTAGTRNFGTGSDAASSMVLGDVEGDGDLDIAVGNSSEQNVVYPNDGSGNFTTSTNFGTGSDDTESIGLGDVDNDGDLDIAVGNASPNVVYLNQPATISLSDSSVSFGSVEKGQSAQDSFRIRNVGGLTLTISGLSDDSDQFSLSPVVPPSLNIAGGDSTTVTVSFSPTSVGGKAGTITISSNDSTSPTKTVSLSGSAADTTAPSVLSGLSATAGPNQVSLSWTANTEPDLSYYIIYRSQTDGFTPVAADSIDKVDKPATTYTNTGLTAGTYYYKLAAVDSTGNKGSPSAQASATLAPAASTGLTAVAGNNQITLSWTANTEPDLSYYIIYQSQTDGFTPVPTDSIAHVDKPTTTYTNTGLTAGTYYYKLAAVDSTGNKSSPSAQASATLAPVISFPDSTLAFGDVSLGGTSILELSISNPGTAVLSISSMTIAGTDSSEFQFQATASIVGAAQTSAVGLVVFTPTSGGSKDAHIVMVHNAVGSPDTLFLSGNANVPSAPQILVTGLNFGDVDPGNSKTLTLNMTNTGASSVSIDSIRLDTGLFTVSATAFVLAVESGRELSITFSPTTAGTVNDSLRVFHNGSGGLLTVFLTGRGVVRGISLSVGSLAFGDVEVGQDSLLTLEVSNTGNISLTISGMTITGTDASDFSVSPTSGTIAGSGSSSFGVTFLPSSVGLKSASLSIAHNAPGDSVSVSLSGTGTAPVLTADFSADTTSGPAALEVQFTDLSGGGVTGWSWDFGDGATSTDQNPSHVYASPGIFSVTVTVTGAAGSSSDTTLVDLIRVPPRAGFTADPLIGEDSLNVAFSDTSLGAVTLWSWSFGDGDSAFVQHPSHTYLDVGLYTVSLGITGPSGSDTLEIADLIEVKQGVVADFSTDTTSGQVPLAVSFTDSSSGPVTGWSWAFGDGDTSSVQSPFHTYTSSGIFGVELAVIGTGDVIDTVKKDSLITVRPLADFFAFPTSGLDSVIVAFQDSSRGGATSWSWDFGDGETSTDQNPEHTYRVAGAYTVGMTVGAPGGSDTIEKLDLIEVKSGVLADFNADSTSGRSPLTVAFIDSSRGSVVSWSWSFGDGDSSAVQNPSHTYSDPGIYSVSLGVTGAGGKSDTTTKASYVRVAPIADFVVDVSVGVDSLEVAFIDSTRGPVTSWSWAFGDGDSSSVQHPTHVYREVGVFSVSLDVSGPSGTDSSRKLDVIEVLQGVKARFSRRTRPPAACL